MGVAHFLDVGYELLGALHVVEQLFLEVLVLPRVEMHLVNIHRGLVHILVVALIEPLLILPLVALDFVYLCCGIGSCFHVVAVGVGFESYLTVAALDAVLIGIVLFETGDKQLPDTSVADLVHGASESVPLVEVTDHAYACGIRSPYSEDYAFFALLLGEMGAEELVSFRNVSLMKEVQGKLVLLGHFVCHFALLLSFRAVHCRSC